MRPTERSQAIAFLLSFAAIPLGCPAEDDDDDTGASTNPSGSNSNSSTATTSAGTDSAGTDSDASDTNPNPTFPMTATNPSDPSDPSDPSNPSDPSDPSNPSDPTTDPDTGYGTYGSGGSMCEGIAVPAVCTTYAAHIVECTPKYAGQEDYIAEYCACTLGYYAPMYGAGCAGAYEDFFACLNALACDNMNKEACATEGAAVDTACGGGGSEGGSDGG